MTIDLVFVTYNRLHYTKLALASVLADPEEEFSLTIWDNASTDGTSEYLKKGVNDHRITNIVYSKNNIGQTATVNEVWSKSKGDLLGKLDNDCLVTPGWTRTIAQAHKDFDNFGVIACWHFSPEDFDYERAKHKIQQFGRHQVLRHPWTGGGAGLVKLKAVKECGLLESSATTSYWIRMALKGYVNGFYFPLIYVEHMDDPNNRYCLIRDKESFETAAAVTVGLQAGRYKDLRGRLQWRQEIIRNLMDDPYDPRYYVGWRRKFRSIKNRIHDFITHQSTTKEIDSTND